MSEELGTLTAPQETVTPVPQLVQCQQLTALSALYKELIQTQAVRKYEDMLRIAAAIKVFVPSSCTSPSCPIHNLHEDVLSAQGRPKPREESHSNAKGGCDKFRRTR